MYDSITLWGKKFKYTKRDQQNFTKGLSVLQFDLNLTLVYIYGSVIKLNKIEVISLGKDESTLYI